MAKAKPTPTDAATSDTQYQAATHLFHDGAEYWDGDAIELSDAQATPLLDIGAITVKAAA